MLVTGNSTDITTYFALRKTSDGTAADGLTISDIDLQYVRTAATPSAKVDASELTLIGDAHAANNAKEVDATDAPGLYRVDWPDAAFAAGAKEVILTVKVATAFTEHLRVEIDAVAPAVWDRVLSGATHNITNSAGRRLRQLQEAGGYSNGFIYIDTVNGVNSSTSFEDGVETNPVDGMANANILAAALNISRFFILPGSTITLGATQSNQDFEGVNWTLALNSQSIVGSHISGATVSGVSAGTGTTQIFNGCMMNATTHRKGTHIINSVLIATQTVGEAGDFFVASCHAGTAGTGTPIIDFGAALNASNVHVSAWEGPIEFQNMGQGTGTYGLEATGRGDMTLNANCTGGNIDVHGHLDVTDNSSGTTITQTSNYTDANVNAQVDVALDTAIPELGVAAPAATPTTRTGLMLMYMGLRNKTIVQTSGTDALEIHNSAGTKITKKLLTDDGADYTEAKMS